MSEKFDGVRAYWDGKNFYHRSGEQMQVPLWFSDILPKGEHIEGELWFGDFSLKSDEKGREDHLF